MTRYEEALQTDVAFPPQNIKNPLCKVISQHGLRQLRITETEKERFVTYYMNGQAEAMYPGEDRVIIPSKGVKSYDQAPEMSAHEIASEMISRIRANTFDVIISNICNGDMVGHTGNFDAAVTACGIVDTVVGQIVSEVYARGGVVLITADHGNVEEMLNTSSGEIDTEHSTYPVPLLIIGKKFANKPSMLASGILADVAPTMLSILGIKRPDSMTGRALV
jgi:2,3-bisphosphoglycerate-independent phosphoglycerate mutase